MSKITDIGPVPRFTEMPNCVWRQHTPIRIYRETLSDGTTKDTLEVGYLDGNDSLFWGPIQIVKAP